MHEYHWADYDLKEDVVYDRFFLKHKIIGI